MLYKEIRDTIRLFIGSIILALTTLEFSFLLIRGVVDETLTFAETIPIWSYIVMMAMAFYLGISLFAQEKIEHAFEYMFSLKYSRNQIFWIKLAPRLAALMAFLLLHIILSQTIRPFSVPGGWFITILMFLSLFLSSTSLSLLQRHHLTNSLQAVFFYMVIYGIAFLIILEGRSLFVEIFLLIRIMIIGFFLISALLFMAFRHHFAKADLSNFTGLFGKSAFSCLKIMGIPAMGLLVIWIVINRFDAPEFNTGFTPEENRSARIDKNNGCYRLWTLSEAPSVDVDSDETLEKYQHLINSDMPDEKSPRDWDQHSYRVNYRFFNQKRNHILMGKANDLDIAIAPDKDLVREILQAREPINRLQNAYRTLLARYQKQLNCPAFVDITRPKFLSLIPNLETWLHVSKLYDWISILDALDSHWDQAAERLIGHIDFQKMVLHETRLLFVNLICKNNMRYSLSTLASLMNQNTCPKSIYQTVLNRLPPGSINELGTRKALEADYLGWADFIDKKQYLDGYSRINKWIARLFFQPNRSKNYFYKPYQEMINLETQAPYQWRHELDYFEEKYQKIKKGNFWWVQNPFGKYIAGEMVIPSLTGTINKTYYLISLVDMVRISAELHLRCLPGQTVESILPRLDTYRTPDPCSGKPFRWNPEKRVLYSLGVDRDDDGGRFSKANFLDTDYILRIDCPNKL